MTDKTLEQLKAEMEAADRALDAAEDAYLNADTLPEAEDARFVFEAARGPALIAEAAYREALEAQENSK